MVIIDNSTIDRMADMPDMVAIFPLLHRIKHKTGCNCRAGHTAQLYDDIKRQIGSLTGEPLDRVKKALSTTEIRVIYRDTRGVMQDKTI